MKFNMIGVNMIGWRFSWQRCLPWSGECSLPERRDTKTRHPDPGGHRTSREPKEDR